VRLPDGRSVEAAGIRERRPAKPDWDYGFYLDARWRPTWKTDVIVWEDFGLPVATEARAILKGDKRCLTSKGRQ
jgi:hypothetical protein